VRGRIGERAIRVISPPTSRCAEEALAEGDAVLFAWSIFARSISLG